MSLIVTPIPSSFTVVDWTKQYISKSKLELTWITQDPQNSDEFYLYLITAVETKDYCRLYEVFQRMLYNVYMSVYFFVVDGQINSTQFQQCSYKYFTEMRSEFVNESYIGIALTFPKLVLYLHALGVSSTVLRSLPSSPPSKPCVSALARISNCSSCLGVPGSVEPCNGLCINVLRGCLVDLAELVGPFQEYVNTLVAFTNNLNFYNPWNAIADVANTMIWLFSTFSTREFSAVRSRV